MCVSMSLILVDPRCSDYVVHLNYAAARVGVIPICPFSARGLISFRPVQSVCFFESSLMDTAFGEVCLNGSVSGTDRSVNYIN